MTLNNIHLQICSFIKVNLVGKSKSSQYIATVYSLNILKWFCWFDLKAGSNTHHLSLPFFFFLYLG